MLLVDPWAPDAAPTIFRWLTGLDAETLGVGGPSEANVPGIGERVRRLLVEVLSGESRRD